MFHRPTVLAMLEELRYKYGGSAAPSAASGAALARSGGGAAFNDWQTWLQATQPLKAAFGAGAVEFMLCQRLK